MTDDTGRRAAAARRLVRGARTATLSTRLAEDGSPYGSLVLAACDQDARPILLISTLAEHTRNIAADDRASLLFDGTAGREDPLTGPRLTILGRAVLSDSPSHRARFLRRHPGAAAYVDFADFAFYRVAVDRAHMVAGFGEIQWIERPDLGFDEAASAAIGAAEADVLAHMNEDHAETIALYARKLAGEADGPWRMVGCDPEGIDLRLSGRLVRLDFAATVRTPDEMRKALMGLADAAWDSRRSEPQERSTVDPAGG